MITLKIKPYSTYEVEILQKMLSQNLTKLGVYHCEGNCETCSARHLCIDLQSAELWCRDLMESGQGV